MKPSTAPVTPAYQELQKTSQLIKNVSAIHRDFVLTDKASILRSLAEKDIEQLRSGKTTPLSTPGLPLNLKTFQFNPTKKDPSNSS